MWNESVENNECQLKRNECGSSAASVCVLFATNARFFDFDVKCECLSLPLLRRLSMRFYSFPPQHLTHLIRLNRGHIS